MAVTRSKRYKKSVDGLSLVQVYPIKEAVAILKKAPVTKFDQTIDLNLQLNIDAKQADQSIRGAVNLPHGTGKKVRVICFVRGEEAKDAEKAGAEFVGAEELVEKVNGGWLEFDAVVAHPDMMRDISKLGRVLGPKGLMPSPKAGTVTKNVGKAVEDLKKGKLEVKNDKTGGVHLICGKLSFSEDKLIDNITACVQAITDLRPQAVKGEFIKGATLSSTMGPGLRLDLSGVARQSKGE